MVSNICLCSPLFGKDFQFDEYVSTGMKPPTSNSEDVDYLAERCVLPILFIAGGLTEQWNKEHPENKISTGAERKASRKCGKSPFLERKVGILHIWGFP